MNLKNILRPINPVLCLLVESKVEDKSVWVGEELRLEVSKSDWQRGLLNEGQDELNVLFIPQKFNI